MGDELVLKCEDCNEQAIYLDLAGFDEAAPHCSACLGEELIGIELEKRRVIAVYEWDEWRKDHPDFRIAT